MSADPFSRLHAALWARLLAHPTIATAVRPRNRIAFDAEGLRRDRDPRKQNQTTSDYPELVLAPNGSTATLWRSSHSAEIVVSWALLLRTGHLDAVDRLLPLQWALLCVFGTADDDFGLEFVHRIEARSAAFQIAEQGDAQPVRQWLSVGTVDVACHFAREHMRSFPC